MTNCPRPLRHSSFRHSSFVIRALAAGLAAGARLAFTRGMAAKQNFFISYNKADAEIAGWIAAQLKEAGWSVVIQSEDFASGGNFVLEMHRRLEECERVIAVLSPDYLTAKYVHAEWGAAFRRDPTGELRLLVPVRVRPCQPPGLLASIVYIDLAGVPEADAAQRLRGEIAKSLRSAERAMAGAATLPSGPATPAGVAAYARHQLPPPPRVFVGRDDEVAALLDQLARGEAGGAAICGSLQGLGGVGKTALALVVAHRLAGGYPAAQLYRDLRGADEKQRTPLAPAEVMRDLILAMRPDCGQLPDDADRLGPIYRSVLAEAGRVLLLLDNAAGAAQVEPLLPPPGCLLLVTSRQHFHLPDCLVRDLDSLPAEEAEKLLARLLRDPARLAGHAAEAARLCGGLPLALKVFAGAIDDESITPVPELLGALRAGEHRLTPVDAAFAVSESLLPEETRAAWRLLSIFTASFDLPAAAAVWEKEAAAARAPMQALVNASLVEFNAESARFRMHDLARQFCDARLSEAVREEARLRHAMHYIAVGTEANRLYLQGGEHMVAGLLLFDRERTHIEAAFAWLQTREDASDAALLVSLVGAVVFVGQVLRFHPRQRIAWLEAQRVAARLAGNRQAEGAALGNLGSAYDDLGDVRKAIEFYEQSLVIAREIGDRRGEGSSLGLLGVAYAALGDAHKAIEFYEQWLVIGREIGDRRGEGNALGNLGNAYAALGDARKAIEFHEQALVVSREIGDRRAEGQDLGNLGLAYAALGDARKAIEFHKQALVIDREIGDRRGEGQDLGNLGVAYATLGDARKAIEFHEQQLVIVREIGDRRGEGSASFDMADELWSTGEQARALELMETAWEIYTAIEYGGAERAAALLQEWRGEMGGRA
jgi:tetratricopeptide (TPR) repeat protein